MLGHTTFDDDRESDDSDCAVHLSFAAISIRHQQHVPTWQDLNVVVRRNQDGRHECMQKPNIRVPANKILALGVSYGSQLINGELLYGLRDGDACSNAKALQYSIYNAGRMKRSTHSDMYGKKYAIKFNDNLIKILNEGVR